MSGSMLSLLSNSDNSLCNRRLYNYVKVPSENISKDYKNLSNFERQNLDQFSKMSMYGAFESFSCDLTPQSVDMSFYNSFKANQTTEQSPSTNFRRPKQPLVQSPRPVSRNSSTTPKIVGAEVKKNIKYQPAYMQRHSTSFGEGFLIQTEGKPQQSYNIHQSKRSSVAFGEEYANLLDSENPSKRSPVSRNFPTLPTSLMEDAQSEIAQTGNCVKDRVSFFNKLASDSGSSTTRLSPTQPRETFISLLRKNEFKDSKTTIIRLSQMMATLSAKSTKRTTAKETFFGMKSPDPDKGKCSAHAYKSGSSSLPMPLKRKPSFEKTKMVTSSIAKNMNSIGTNLKRHSLMEDLSLVVPVKLRIAEFEKRILASK